MSRTDGDKAVAMASPGDREDISPRPSRWSVPTDPAHLSTGNHVSSSHSIGDVALDLSYSGKSVAASPDLEHTASFNPPQPHCSLDASYKRTPLDLSYYGGSAAGSPGLKHIASFNPPPSYVSVGASYRVKDTHQFITVHVLVDQNRSATTPLPVLHRGMLTTNPSIIHRCYQVQTCMHVSQWYKSRNLHCQSSLAIELSGQSSRSSGEPWQKVSFRTEYN